MEIYEVAVAFGLHKIKEGETPAMPKSDSSDLIRQRLLHAQDPEKYPKPEPAAMDATAVMSRLAT